MCIIQCVNCPSCLGLNLCPLKSDYFDNEDFKNFTLKTCRLVSCRSKDSWCNHQPWLEQLMRLPPIFRVRIYGDDDLWHHNPFLH